MHTVSISAQTRQSIVRALKVFGLAVIVLAATSAESFVAGNGLGLAPTVQSIVMAVVVPILAGAEKWAGWEQTQV